MVLDLCRYRLGIDDRVIEMDEHQRMHVLTANDRMTQDALRVLGMAYRLAQTPDVSNPDELEQGLIFVGLIGMIDPRARKCRLPWLTLAVLASAR